MNILITGAGGYIGHNLANALAVKGHKVRALMRGPAEKSFAPSVQVMRAGNYHDPDWNGASVFAGQEIVIHAAARVHTRREPDDIADAYQKDNIDFSLRMAGQARAAGVKRFIFISSVGAQLLEDRFHEGRIRRAQAWKENPYRMSKLEAERKLLAFGKEKGLGVICVRLPMVYGWAAPGSFRTLVRLIKKGIPVPFGKLAVPRAFVSINTVQDFMACCVATPAAEGKTWAIRDRDEISPSDFAKKIAGAAHLRPPRLVSCPPWLLQLGAMLVGYRQTARSLTESVQVNLEPVERKLGWHAPFTVAEGLEKAFS